MTALKIDDAHVQWTVDGTPASEAEAISALASKPLLLLMHGFGSFEGDLIGLAPQLPTGFVCASPRALLVAPPPIVNGFAWWPLEVGADGLPVRGPDPEQFEGTGPHQAALAVLAWIDDLDARVAAASNGSGLGDIAVMGFSQGGCMVTSLLRMRVGRFSCGVNCSGFVAPGAFDDSALTAQRTPLFWGRDEADPIIGQERIVTTAAWAEQHTDLEARLYEGIAHGIGIEELHDIKAFLETHVPAVAAQ